MARTRNNVRKEGLKIRFKKIFAEARRLQEKVTLRSVNLNRLGWYRQVLANERIISQNLPNVDLIIASYPPHVVLWLGRYFARKYKVPWVADYRDLGALRLDGRKKSVGYIDYVIEKFLLRSARAVTTVSRTLIEILSQAYSKSGAVIYNGWNKSSFMINDNYADIFKTLSSTFENKKYVYYAGRMYPHRMRSIILLLEVIKYKKRYNLFIRSLGPEEMEQIVLAKARDLGIAERIKILPPCTHNQVYHESQNAAVNLIFEDLDTTNYWSTGTVTGKLFELLPLRPAILAIAMKDSEIGQILDLTQKGQLCSSVDEIETFLNIIEVKEFHYEGNIDEIQRFSKKNQTKRICEFFDSVCQ
jgi:hypothetical protein